MKSGFFFLVPEQAPPEPDHAGADELVDGDGGQRKTQAPRPWRLPQVRSESPVGGGGRGAARRHVRAPRRFPLRRAELDDRELRQGDEAAPAGGRVVPAARVRRPAGRGAALLATASAVVRARGLLRGVPAVDDDARSSNVDTRSNC